MLVFWLIDMSVIAYLAKVWQSPECISDLRNQYMCAPYIKRNTGGRRTTSFNAYYGALVAGALLAASEL
jgi:hypothetical protein